MYTLGPSGMPDPPFYGFREYWRRSYDGNHLFDYEAGVAMGKADLDNEDSANWQTILDQPSSKRNPAWQATVDGYTDATRDERGSNSLSNGL